ncbi:MAG TPA: FUSC family protein [Acidimicrobiales bacterium]|nr:FUSC family protein [Acidimicrobiales bacterium]
MDRFLGSDPGLNRFRSALQSVLTIAIVLEAEWLFVHFTHALQNPASTAALTTRAAAAIAIANHEFLVIAMLLGAIIGMISTFSVMDQTARGQLVTMVFLPVPMIPLLALGLAVTDRTLSLVVLVLVLALGTYCRRFGPRGLAAGLLMFMGYFLGFFLHGAVGVGDVGWLAAEIGVGLVVATLVRFLLFYPRPARALARTQRSYAARARKIVVLALALFDDPAHTPREVRRLHRQLARLNEAALMIDAQLGDPNAVADGSSGQLLHQRLFDAELALTNIARFTQAMARLDLSESQRAEVRLTLESVVKRNRDGVYAHATNLLGLLRRDSDDDRLPVVIVHRFAGSVIAMADAMSEWLALGQTDGEKGTFQPAVALFGGWLPGSAQVSAAASIESGRGWSERIRIAPYTRTAIQMGVAAGGAIALGVVVSSYRFYWALIAAFITFMGANNSGEQVRKALFRVAGTVVGIVVGSLLVKAVGHHTYWSVAVILLALFFGFYLMRVNYAFMVVGITVMVSQLYLQLGEYSNSLLVLRLEETALGAGVAIIVVLFVLPLRTRRVLRVALRDYVHAVADLIDDATSRLLHDSPSAVQNLRSDARSVDASYQALIATAQPLRRGRFGQVDDVIDRALRVAGASRYYSRNLIVDVSSVDSLDDESQGDLERGVQTFHESLKILGDAFTGSRNVTYTRSASLFDSVERRLAKGTTVLSDGELAVRDLKLLDGTMVQMADVLGLDVTDFDTALA